MNISEGNIMDRGERLEALRDRLRRQQGPTGNVMVRRAGEVELLDDMEPGELERFARSVGARVVSRCGGREYEFSGQAREEGTTSEARWQ